MSTPARRRWNLENFTTVTRAEGGDEAVAVLRYGLDWAKSHRGGHAFISDRPNAPLYFSVPDRAAEPVRRSSPPVAVVSA